MVNLDKLQQRILKNKEIKGFNTTNIPLEFCYLQSEVTEAFQSWHKQKQQDDLGLELADIAIFTLGLAQMLGISLEKAILEKINTNEKRVYVDGMKIEPKLKNLDSNRFNINHAKINNKENVKDGKICN